MLVPWILEHVGVKGQTPPTGEFLEVDDNAGFDEAHIVSALLYAARNVAQDIAGVVDGKGDAAGCQSASHAARIGEP